MCDFPIIYPLSQNMPPFQQLYANLPFPPRTYPPFEHVRPSHNLPFLSEYTPLFKNYMRPFQNLPLPPRIYPSLQQPYATLSESTPPSQNIPLSSTTIILCETPIISPPPSEYTPPPLARTICDIPRIYHSVIEYAPFSRTTCICERIYHSLPELKKYSGREE